MSTTSPQGINQRAQNPNSSISLTQTFHKQEKPAQKMKAQQQENNQQPQQLINKKYALSTYHRGKGIKQGKITHNNP
jgi:hypothetical protein